MSVILSPYRESLGKTHNIYASPQWVRVDGEWGAIDDVLAVTYNGHESYEIQLGKDRIFFEPLWDAMPYALSRVVSSREFGPVLDLKSVLQKDLGWRVTTYGAVSRTEAGWIFDRCEPKICGLFMDKWHNLMPKAVTVTENEVWINTKTALNDISSVGTATTVNLDPDTINPVANGYAYVYRVVAETWQQTIDGAGTGSVAAAMSVGTWDRAAPAFNYILRTLLRFDTSAYPVPIDAYLRANIDPPSFDPDPPKEERDYLAAQAALNFPLADNANYAKAKTAIDTHGIGAMLPVGAIGQGFRKSADIVAAGEWECSATADFVLSEHYDYTENVPPDGLDRSFDYTPLGGYPYLEITPGAMGNRIPMMNAGVT